MAKIRKPTFAMATLNVLDPVTVNRWKANFTAEQNNPYLPFVQQPILLDRATYDEICTDLSLYVRFYFGLTNDGIPKIIAVPALKLEPADSHETGYADLLIPGRIFELYSAQSITFELAKGYTLNWEAYQAHELWMKGFLIPRPNLLHLFLEAEEEAIEITLGVKKAIGPMISKQNPQQGDVYVNRVLDCPPNCTPDTNL
jgi:hypothetical protein